MAEDAESRGQVEEILQELNRQISSIVARTEQKLAARKLLHAVEKGPFVTKVALKRCVYVLTRFRTSPVPPLSPGQKEIASCLLEGLDRKAIARQLRISPRTVDTHVERLYLKCGVACRQDLLQRLPLLS